MAIVAFYTQHPPLYPLRFFREPAIDVAHLNEPGGRVIPTKSPIWLPALGACALVVLSLSYPRSREAERAGIPREASANVSPENDFAAHVAALKKKLPSDDFSIIVQPPFVVVGDESEAAVQEIRNER